MQINEYPNLDATAAYRSLRQYALLNIKSLLSPERVRDYCIDAGGDLRFSYAEAPVDFTVIRLFQDLANEQRLLEQFEKLRSGEYVNVGENRMVLHHLTRAPLGSPVTHEGVNLRKFYAEQTARIADFSGKVHDGTITGSTGKPFRNVVQIGIGGSDLGPRALYIALENWAKKAGRLYLPARFLSNVDPDDAYEVLSGLDPETSLFILVSKSGTTQETLANHRLVEQWMRDTGVPGVDPAGHMIAVTAKGSPLAESSGFLDSFYINDFIGGRYSSTSAVGGTVLSLAFGPETFEQLLKGANEADIMAEERRVEKNPALMDASIGMYYRNILQYPMIAILPYSQALRRFPAHLQQLDMESNGKTVNRRGEYITYKTGPVVFGEPGTNGQHSFYQLLHQGSDTVPMEFILFREAQGDLDCVIEGSSNQKKLMANCVAQIAAFTAGKGSDNPNRYFPGGRPCALLFGSRLEPRSLGALLAHFENKVMFQGFMWNLNSFDQEGVQLGKLLTNTLLAGKEIPPTLAEFSRLIGL